MKLKGLVLTLIMLLILVACTPMTPKAVLQEAFEKSKTMTSYAFEMSGTLKLKEGSEGASMLTSLLEGATISAVGNHDESQRRSEMVLSVALEGGLKIALDIPIIVFEDIVYVKVPSFSPFFELPSELVGKYLKINPEDYEENVIDENGFSVEEMEALSIDILGILIDDFGDTTFVTEVEKNNIPSNFTDAKHVVNFTLTDATLEQFVDIAVQTTGPKVLDVIAKEEYRKVLDINLDEIEQYKTELAELSLNSAEFAELREQLTINEVGFTLGVNKGGHLSYQSWIIDLSVNEYGSVTQLILHVDSQYTAINKEQVFKQIIPQDSDVVSINDLDKYGLGGF